MKESSFLSATSVTGALHCCITLNEGEPSTALGASNRNRRVYAQVSPHISLSLCHTTETTRHTRHTGAYLLASEAAARFPRMTLSAFRRSAMPHTFSPSSLLVANSNSRYAHRLCACRAVRQPPLCVSCRVVSCRYVRRCARRGRGIFASRGASPARPRFCCRRRPAARRCREPAAGYGRAERSCVWAATHIRLLLESCVRVRVRVCACVSVP